MKNPSETHLELHRQQMRDFLELNKADPEAALAFARSAVEKAGRSKRNDPRRGDALELLATMQIKRKEFEKAIVLTTELVRIRKRSRPLENELLALALGSHAIALFALGRSEKADATLREELQSWRASFGAYDLRLAQKLELYAMYGLEEFGRRRWAIEILREAVKIRERNPDAPAWKHAEVLLRLAIHEVVQSEYADADTNLAKADALLRKEIARDPEHEENKASLARILVLRAGIAGAFAQKEQAIVYLEEAKRIEISDRVLQAEKEIVAGAALSAVLHLVGDIPRAIAEQYTILDILNRHDDLVVNGSLERGMIGDTLSWLGSLHLELDELDSAREAITAAREQLGDTSGILFQLSELERKSGNEAEAVRNYQEALRRRKESATEVSVMFGTNRQPEEGPERARFGGEPSENVSLGYAVVLVPGWEFSTEAWLKSSLPVPIPVGMATNPDPLVIRDKDTFADGDFQTTVRKTMARAHLYPKSALVFVHGFNVTFDEALKRVAQLVRDLNYDSAAFVFSWPSKGNWWRYGTDRAAADRAAEGLVNFLRTIETESGAEKIHIIAHSMGNRVLLPALVKAANADRSTISKIGEVILAAPAVPNDEFRNWIDKLSPLGLSRVTLYASAMDKAMMGGFLREWGNVLAGYVASGRPLIHPSVHSIDLSEAGSDGLTNLNHDVFASNPVMTEDIRQLLQRGKRPPHARIKSLKPRPSEKQAEYWYYEP